jgi:hypothetical protein
VSSRDLTSQTHRERKRGDNQCRVSAEGNRCNQQKRSQKLNNLGRHRVLYKTNICSREKIH